MQERQDAMNKYFSLLGLREDAGKDDVKAAYERRVRKYKSSDYDDDPEYVRKKLAELKVAYEQAYRMAGSGSTSAYRRDDFDLPASSRTSDSQRAHRQLHDKEEKEARRRRAKRIRENEFRKDQIEAEEEGSLFRKPDLSALRHKAESLRDEIKAQAGDLKNTVSEALDDNAEHASRRDTARNTAQKKENAVPKFTKSVRRLDDHSGGTIIEAPAQTKRYSGRDTESASRNIKFFGVVVALIVMLVSGVAQCGYSDYDDFDDVSESYGYGYSYISDRDQMIFDTAMDCSDLLFDAGYAGSYTDYGYDDDELQTQADQFAENYLDMDRLSDVLTYLYDNYSEFMITDEDPLETQIAEVLKFYGFLDPESAAGYINPYNDETITNTHTYLLFLNEYFEKNGLTEEYEDY